VSIGSLVLVVISKNYLLRQEAEGRRKLNDLKISISENRSLKCVAAYQVSGKDAMIRVLY
jgi:hypothetical protein